MSTFQLIKQTVEDMGYEPRSYSGRGMYGERCLGVTIDRDSNHNILEFVAALVHELSAMDDEDAEEALDFIKSAINSDSMGLGSVVYFPRVRWQDEDEDEDE